MSRTKYLLVAALVGCLTAFTATANGSQKPLKINSLTPAGPGVKENPDCDGIALMFFRPYPSPRTAVILYVSGFLPNTTYGVEVAPGITDPDAFTTDADGDALWITTAIPSDITQQNPILRVFRWDGVQATINEVSFDELRAIGCASGDCPIGQPCAIDEDCDDGGLCTIDTCNSGSCFHALELCDDGNPCTADFCNPFDGACENDALPNCP